MILEKDIKHIAELARLEIDEKEIKKYQKELGEILEYVDKLKEIDTQNVPTENGGFFDLENVCRQDKEFLDFEKTDLIDLANQKENGQVKVKQILKH